MYIGYFLDFETPYSNLIYFIRPDTCDAPLLVFSDQRDQGEKQRRKMTASGDAISLVVQNLRPGTQKIKYLVLT